MTQGGTAGGGVQGVGGPGTGQEEDRAEGLVSPGHPPHHQH